MTRVRGSVRRSPRSRSAAALGALLFVVAAAVLARQPVGAVTFASQDAGKVVSDFGGDEGVFALASESDGALVAGGRRGRSFWLARYSPDGRLDRGFRARGTVDGTVQDLLVRPDGRILAAGWSELGSLVLARYLPDGRLDPGFGTRGVVRTRTNFGRRPYDTLISISIGRGGSIVGAGISGPSVDADFAVARYTADGRLDSGFARDGTVLTDIDDAGDTAYDLVVKSDGKIVAAGQWSDGRGFALVRYLPDGRLDRGFGERGIVRTRLGGIGVAFAIAVQRDGKLVVAGRRADRTGDHDVFALARYLPDGRLDRGFGRAGKVLTGFGGNPGASAWEVALQPDGKIVVAGERDLRRGQRADFALTRYLPDGRLDRSFGSAGRFVAGFGPRSSYDYVRALLVLRDGKIVAAGSTEPVGIQGSGDSALLRLTPAGRLDPDFGRR